MAAAIVGIVFAVGFLAAAITQVDGLRTALLAVTSGQSNEWVNLALPLFIFVGVAVLIGLVLVIVKAVF